jgi:hypothetical protein
MIVDLPSAATARLSWEMLPTQDKQGMIEGGSSVTAIPIDELKRHPEQMIPIEPAAVQAAS